MNSWNFAFLLPNIKIKKPVENDHLAIIPHNDPRVEDIKAANPASEYLIERFTDQFGRKKYPSLLVVREDVVGKYQEIEALIDFRNLFAISCILHSWQRFLENPSFNYSSFYSDYFDLYPITIHRNREDLICASPAKISIERPDAFQGQTSPLLSTSKIIEVEPDELILNLLLDFWHRSYMFDGRLGKRNIKALFRSLQMAYLT